MTQFYVVDNTSTVYPVNIYLVKVAASLSVVDGYNPIYNVLIQEIVNKTSTAANTAIFAKIAQSLAKLREANNGLGGSVYWEDENIVNQFTDILSYVPAVLVPEIAVLVTRGTIVGNSSWSFADSFTSNAVLTGQYGKLIQNVLTTTASLTGTPAWIIRAALQFDASLTSEGKLNLLKQEYIKFHASIISTLLLQVADTVTVTAGISVVINKLLSIKDSLIVKGIATSTYEAAIYLQESLRLAFQLASGKGGSIAESMQILAAYTAIFGFSANAVSTVALADSTQPSLVFVLEASDTAKIIDPAGVDGGFDPTQFLGLILNEQFSIKIGYNSDDGLWTGWVMNTQNAAVTNYSDWNFNSFATLSTVDVAASSTGLYALGGTNDSGAPISAMATFAKSDFGDSRLKRMPYAYIGVRATGQLYFITETDDGVERVYSLVATTSGPHTERVQMARGVASRYWQFTLENVAGADFRLDELELLPVTLSRRV